MKTLHIGLRVTDLDRSLAFYRSLGYEMVGRVPETPIGQLTMLKLPDDDFVSIELVLDGKPIGGTEVSHLVVQVESMDAVLTVLSGRGVAATGAGQHGADGPRTAWVTDPDGRRIELVQWPAGHPDGMTAADFTEAGAADE